MTTCRGCYGVDPFLGAERSSAFQLYSDESPASSLLEKQIKAECLWVKQVIRFILPALVPAFLQLLGVLLRAL